jgi:hypothetical protein
MGCVSPPSELIDPDGEGIYLLNDPVPWRWGVLLEAAWRLFGDAREWRSVCHETVYMRPVEDGSDEWRPADIGRCPYGWRLNLPRRWRPVAYAYCVPSPEGAGV